MSKNYKGYKSFDYLERGVDYPAFELAAQVDRVPQFVFPLDDDDEVRAMRLLKDTILVSLHDHLGCFPEPVSDTKAYIREGRQAAHAIEAHLMGRSDLPT